MQSTEQLDDNHVPQDQAQQMGLFPLLFYNKGKRLGKGAFGSVRTYAKKDLISLAAEQGVRPSDYKRYPDRIAVKKIDKNNINDKNVSRELTLLATLDHHPNVVRYYGKHQSPTSLRLVMELCPCSLEGLMEHHRGGLEDEEVSFLMQQILYGVAFIHEKEAIHRDIKPGNILLTSDKGDFDPRTVSIRELRVKLADFGLSRFVRPEESGSRSRRDDDTMTATGTPLFMAPEIRESYVNREDTANYGRPIDIWSSGVVAYYLREGGAAVLGRKVIHDANELLGRSRRARNVDFEDFLRLQLAPEENRWSARELLKHRFVVPFTKKLDIFSAIQPLDQENLEIAIQSLPDLNFANDDGNSPLMHAVKNKSLEAAKILVQSGKAEVNFRGREGLTALFHAVEAMDVDIVKYLVDEAGADVDVQDDGGDTALFAAVSKRQMNVIRILVQAGADISHKNGEGKTAIYWAIIRKNAEAAIFLLENSHEDLNVWNGAYNWSYLKTACSNGNLAVVTYLVEEAKVDLELEDKSNKSALFWAVESGHEDVVSYLLKNPKVDVNRRDKFGETALFKAVQEQHDERLKIVNCLIDSGGVDVTIKNKGDRTVLYFAIMEGSLEMVKALVEKYEPNLSKGVDKEKTALCLAVEEECGEIVHFLSLQNNCGVNIQDGRDETPLFRAALNNRLNMVKSMAANCKDIDVNIKNCENKTALYWAIVKGNLEMTKILVKQCGADVNDRNGKYKWTALQAACSIGSMGIVKFLVEEGGADLDLTNDGKRDVDRIIEEDMHPEICRYLERKIFHD